MPLTENCKQALIDVDLTRRRLNKFWNLIYAFSVAAVIFSIVLVVSLVWGNNPSKALTGLAAISSGGGLLFVIGQRKDASKDHDDARDRLRADCKIEENAMEGVALNTAGLPSEAIDILSGK